MVSLMDLPGFFRRDNLTLRQMEGEPVPFAVFEGSLPTAGEVRTITKRRYGLHLVSIPPASRDLQFLDRFENRLEHLGIADFDVEDATYVGSLTNLRSLYLHVNQQLDADFSRLTSLGSYDGFLKHFEDILRLPLLERLSLQAVRAGRLGRIPASLQWLSLVDAQNLDMLPESDRASALKEVYIANTRHFDMRTLESHPLLETVGLSRARHITSVDALLTLKRLKAVAFDGCPVIEPKTALLGLTDVTINVLGRNPFGSRFRAEASRTQSIWNYFGSARRPPSDEY